MSWINAFWICLLFLLILEQIECQSSLKCYACNSNYNQCGESGNFDSSIQTLSYCYGICVKLVVYPGDFIVRSCSTFFYDSPPYLNLNSTQKLDQNQCYLGSYFDSSTLTNKAYYMCFCNDQIGCNLSNRIKSLDFRINIFLLALYFLSLF